MGQEDQQVMSDAEEEWVDEYSIGDKDSDLSYHAEADLARLEVYLANSTFNHALTVTEDSGYLPMVMTSATLTDPMDFKGLKVEWEQINPPSSASINTRLTVVHAD